MLSMPNRSPVPRQGDFRGTPWDFRWRRSFAGGPVPTGSASASEPSKALSKGRAAKPSTALASYARKGQKVKNPLIVIEWYEDLRDAVKHFLKSLDAS
eukprot:Skav223997  [mRNA]  locus=scaffold1943:671076:674765:- [translate_table: standard]